MIRAYGRSWGGFIGLDTFLFFFLSICGFTQKGFRVAAPRGCGVGQLFGADAYY